MTDLRIGYVAFPEFRDFHARQQRWAVMVAHRRCGKTVACVLDLIDSALRNKRQKPPPSYAYVAPLYRQAKQVAWGYLKDYGLKVPGAEASESELKVVFPNGGMVRLYGADNPDSLRGIYLDGVILDEAADMSPRINEVLRPTLSDYKGWCVWIGTPKGMNDFYDLVHGTANWVGAKDDPEWFFRMFKASQTGRLDREELASAKRQLTPEQYAQEYECSFEAAILGAYYGREVEAAETEKRIIPNIYDPSLQVHTAWDLGHSNATAIWFYQQSGFEIRIIDFYTASNIGLDHFVALLQEKSARPGNVKGYKYGRHYLPHDVAAKKLTAGTHNTQLAMLRDMGLQNVQPVLKLSIDDGIEAVRKLFPRCWFDREKCTHGLKALRQYHREWDDTRKVFIERPMHDWCITGDTEVLTRYGTCPINLLPSKGEVWTQCGWKQYVNPRITRRNAPLVEVKFTGGLTVRCTPDHPFRTASGWTFAEHLQPGIVIQSSLTPLRSISMVASIAAGRARTTTQEAVQHCIAWLGQQHSVKFPRAVISTIATAISPTMRFQISNASIAPNTWRSPGRSVTPIAPNISARKPVTLPPNGIVQRLAGSGTAATRSGRRVGPSGRENPSHVWNAVKHIARSFAQMATSRNFVVTGARSLTIASVEPLSETEDVWCLTVPGDETFSLANGAVVHNSSDPADAFRYLAIGLRPATSEIKNDGPRRRTQPMGWIY